MQTGVETVADRIQLKMKAKGCKQSEMTAATGATKGTVSKWVSGTNTPKGEFLIRLAAFLGTNSSWILTGQGSDAPYPIDGQTLESMNIRSADDMDASELSDDEFEAPYYKKVPVSGGSQELPIHERTNRKVKIKRDIARRAGASMSQTFCYDLDGNSMEPKISDKAQCAADSSKKEIKDGKIYCFRHGVMRRTKYLLWQPDGSLLIRSENSDYDDEVVAREDLNDIEVLGWVYTWNNVDTW